MINTKPVLGDMRLNVTDNLGKYEVFNGKTWLIMENYDTIESLRAEINRLKSLCISYIDEEWSGTSSYQNKIDEVNLGHFKESE